MGLRVTTTINLDDMAIAGRISKLLDDSTRLEIHNLFAKMMDPYVPFLEGPLSPTAEVTPQDVRYTQPYAHYQYTGSHFNFTTDYHQLATAYWDKAMMRDKGEEFVEQVRQIIARKAKELYG